MNTESLVRVTVMCDYCGKQFDPYRSNQRFCTPGHRRAFERLINRIAGKLYPEIRAAVREILAENREEKEIKNEKPL